MQLVFQDSFFSASIASLQRRINEMFLLLGTCSYLDWIIKFDSLLVSCCLFFSSLSSLSWIDGDNHSFTVDVSSLQSLSTHSKLSVSCREEAESRVKQSVTVNVSCDNITPLEVASSLEIVFLCHLNTGSWSHEFKTAQLAPLHDLTLFLFFFSVTSTPRMHWHKFIKPLMRGDYSWGLKGRYKEWEHLLAPFFSEIDYTSHLCDMRLWSCYSTDVHVEHQNFISITWICFAVAAAFIVFW